MGRSNPPSGAQEGRFPRSTPGRRPSTDSRSAPVTTVGARHARPMNLTRSLRLLATTLATGLCGLSSWVAPSATASSPAASWQWPLAPPPPLIRPFDPPEAPWLPGHRGIDLGATPGQPVLAVAAGTVTYAGEVAGVGVVTVDHGDLRSTYQPVVAQVQAGQHVEAGTVLGAVVTVGSHCLPASCLHLGARRGDELRRSAPAARAAARPAEARSRRRRARRPGPSRSGPSSPPVPACSP